MGRLKDESRRQATELSRVFHRGLPAATGGCPAFRASDYWIHPWETAARAFSAYVKDKVAERGGRSHFLSYGSDNRFYRLVGIRPFPEGEERTAMNAAIDRFIKALRTREGAGGRGGASGFSLKCRKTPEAFPVTRSNEPSTNSEGLSGAAGLAFRVFDSLEAAFGPNRGIRGKVKGDYLPKDGIIALFRDSLDGAEDAARTLRHETLVHFGLNLLDHATEMAFLGRIGTSSGRPFLARLFAEVEKEYPEYRNDEFRIAEEVFTKIAEQTPGPLHQWFDQIEAKLASRKAAKRRF